MNIDDGRKWLALDIADIPGNAQEKIGQATVVGIPLLSFSLTEPRNVSVVAFPDEKFEEARDHFGLTDYKLSYESTELPKVSLMKCTYFPITIEGNIIPQWERLNPILRRYANRLEVECIVSYSPNMIYPVISDDKKLYLRIASRSHPVSEALYEVQSLFGVEAHSTNEPNKTYRLYDFAGDEFIIADDVGNVAAEVRGTTLYILFNLPDYQGAAELFDKILKEYCRLRILSPEDRNAHFEKLGLAQLKNSQRHYLEIFQERLNSVLRDLENSIKMTKSEVHDHQRLMVEGLRKIATFEEKLNRLRLVSEPAEGKNFLNEFDKLRKLPGVEKIRVANDTISIFTSQIDIPHLFKIYDIGKFRIDIKIDGKGGIVKCFNLTRNVKKDNGGGEMHGYGYGFYGHPHIDVSGNCCFGDIAEQVTKLLAKYEVVILTQLILQFLKSYNKDSPHARIEFFPVRCEFMGPEMPPESLPTPNQNPQPNQPSPEWIG